MKRNQKYKYKGSSIDLCMDGMMPHERIKGKVKKYFGRKLRKQVKITSKQIESEEE